METTDKLLYRPVDPSDFNVICKFPQNAEELFFMFPKAEYPLTEKQLEVAVNDRFDSTVILLDSEVVGFANFYEKEENHYCSIGNVIVSSKYRNRRIGASLIRAMERIALEKYNASETHISCFNTNTKGLLLYSGLGYIPCGIEKRITSQNEFLALIRLKKAIK